MAQLADQIGVPAQVKLESDALNEGSPAFFLQPISDSRDPVSAEAGQRLTTPQSVGLAEQCHRVIMVATRGESTGLTPEPTESVHVNGLGIRVEQVATRPPDQSDVGVTSGLAQ
jgi:hypothetical protein